MSLPHISRLVNPTDASGQGYQTLINAALRAAIDPDAAPVTMKALRAALDERFALPA